MRSIAWNMWPTACGPTAAVWMGLTAGCAQCHDHKYDPLSQREYFQLFAYFNNVPEKGIGGGKKNVPPLLDLATSEEAAQADGAAQGHCGARCQAEAACGRCG